MLNVFFKIIRATENLRGARRSWEMALQISLRRKDKDPLRLGVFASLR
jgi:hypothetical protein